MTQKPRFVEPFILPEFKRLNPYCTRSISRDCSFNLVDKMCDSCRRYYGEH